MLVCVVRWYLFHVALWSPAGKGLTFWLPCLFCLVTFPNMCWPTSELRARLADRSKAVLLLWIFRVFLSCVYYAFVCVCLYVPCGHLLGKGCPLGSRLWCLTVSLSLSLCQVRYLIVSITDLCTLTYFHLGQTSLLDNLRELFSDLGLGAKKK